jgi:membrane protein
MLSNEQHSGRQAVPLNLNTPGYLGVGSVAIESPKRGGQAGLVQRGRALLQRVRSRPIVIGVAAAAIPFLILKLKTPKRRQPPVQPRREGAMTWIMGAWDAFVLIRALQRHYGKDAAPAAKSPIRSDLASSASERTKRAPAAVTRHRRLSLKSVYVLLKASVSSWIDDFAPSMGAALAYYTVFSIAPLLVITIAVAALAFGQSTAQQEIMDQIRGLVGPQGADAIQTMLVNAQKPKEGAFASIGSILMLLVGATTVFSELESDLNRIWRVAATKQSGLWGLLRSRVLSLGLVISMGFLLLVSLVVNAGLAAWGKYWSGWFFGVEVALQAANFVLSLAVFTLMFALMYKVLPKVKIAWRDVWVGAAFTALLFSVGKFLIGLYIGKAGIASSYGAAGALVVLLVWVYYSAQVFLLGAEFTRAYAESHGSRQDQGSKQSSQQSSQTNWSGPHVSSPS